MTIAAFISTSRPEQFAGFLRADAGHHRDDALRAVLQLLGSGLDVDHQVAVGLADANHRDRRQHVEHHLGGRAGLETRGPGDDFGPDRRRDDQVDEVLQLGARPAGDEDDARALLARAGERAAHELRDAAGRDADDDVALARRAAARCCARLPRSCPRRLRARGTRLPGRRP